MVDPNRKINRLSDKDNEFLKECETEFALRYTAEDEDFMAHCAKPVPEPPMLDNWSGAGDSGGGGGGRGDRGGGGSPYNNRYNSGQRRGGGGADRGWQRRGGGYNYNSNNERGFRDNRNNRNNRYEPYQRRDRGGFGGTPDRPFDQGPKSRNEPPQASGSPMKVRRDYGNFVPASRD